MKKIILSLAITSVLFGCNSVPVEPTQEKTPQEKALERLENFKSNHQFIEYNLNDAWKLSGIEKYVFPQAGYTSIPDFGDDTIKTSILFNRTSENDSIWRVSMRFPITGEEFAENDYEQIMVNGFKKDTLTSFIPAFCILDFYMPKSDYLLTEGVYSMSETAKEYRIIKSDGADKYSYLFYIPLPMNLNLNPKYDPYRYLNEAFLKVEIKDNLYQLDYWLHVDKYDKYIHCKLTDGHQKAIKYEVFKYTFMENPVEYEFCIGNPTPDNSWHK